MERKTSKLLYAAFFLLLFAFLFIWYSRIHALIPFDGDDWSYLAYVRSATPVWGAWNPAKVFPEIVYPFFSSIAAFVVMPLTGDYISAQTIMHAFVVSAAVTGYAWCFASLMRRVFSCSRLTASLLTTIFCAFHFLALRTAQENNTYLFSSVSVNCYYNYLLPTLLNASLVMLLLVNPQMEAFLHIGRPEAKGIFSVIVYLALFSNLSASGILAAYAGSRILLYLIQRRKTFRLKPFLLDNAFPLGILAAWLISAVFELNGGRAADAMDGMSLLSRLKTTCYLLKNAVMESNRLFLISSAVIVVSALICMVRSGGLRSLSPALSSVLSILLITLAAITVYMVLLCAAVDPYKITTCEYLLVLFFHVFLLVLTAMAYLIGKHPKLLSVLPLLTLFMVSCINTSGNTFRDSNTCNLPAEQCTALSRNIVQQFQDADAAGLDTVILHLPQFAADPETQSNWPYSLSLMRRASDTLYRHGVISREMDVIPVVDPALNAQYHLPIPSE